MSPVAKKQRTSGPFARASRSGSAPSRLRHREAREKKETRYRARAQQRGPGRVRRATPRHGGACTLAAAHRQATDAPGRRRRPGKKSEREEGRPVGGRWRWLANCRSCFLSTVKRESAAISFSEQEARKKHKPTNPQERQQRDAHARAQGRRRPRCGAVEDNSQRRRHQGRATSF